MNCPACFLISALVSGALLCGVAYLAYRAGQCSVIRTLKTTLSELGEIYEVEHK
jgi:hypothetical protein